MRNIYYNGMNTPRRSLFSRCTDAVFAVLGALLSAGLLCHALEAAVSSWSPTETARQCFSYPEEPSLPDREALGSILLSAAFFGSDALYFDSGEENTGTSDPMGITPSDISSEEAPHAPLGEQSVPNTDAASIYDYDRSQIKEGESALLPYDLSGGAKAGQVLLSNTTSLIPDTEAALSGEYPIRTNLQEYSEDAPLILIIHTHGTEAYSPDGAVSTSPNAIQRSSDTSENIVAVGAVMAELLNKAGIPTLHCEIMHDLESYTRSYDLAADTIQKYLSQYPSIKYVFDVHRDAIVRTNGDLIRPVTVINGEIAAQIMLLVGTNEKGADHPDWQTNFTVAAKLQARLTESYQKFARPINIRGASFNEQFTPGSLLIEIGSAANSLKEAQTAARYLTYTIIDTIKDNAE